MDSALAIDVRHVEALRAHDADRALEDVDRAPKDAALWALQGAVQGDLDGTPETFKAAISASK